MEFQMRNKTFISSMVGVAAAAAVAGSANAAIVTSLSPDVVDVSTALGANTDLFIFASGQWKGNVGETPIAGFANVSNDSRGRYATASYTSGSDGNFTEGAPFIFQLYGQRVATAASGTENRFSLQTNTVNKVASGFAIDGSLGALDSAGSSGWAETSSTLSLGFTYYRNAATSFTVASTTYAAGLYTGGQFYGQSGYFGFRFSTDGGTNWNYGWAFGTGGSGYGAPGFEMSQWGYNTVVNQGIAAGAVPAPGALALLGLAGLAGGRRRRA
jgi:MYXO-CTERM domain-containing protein